ncbi:hypothetical protein D3C87_1676880 [compost metagenome]
MVVKGKKGKKQIEKIGELLGDVGDISDTRSWISKKDKKIKITAVTISSSEDVLDDEGTSLKCDKQAWVIEWDSKKQKFNRKSIEYSEKDFKFVPAAQVAEKCI